MKIEKIILLAIVFLAFTIRFYKLQEVPPALNLDEVAIGYNAYSILKTGRDEYGLRFPVFFRPHDDYKPPLYIYLAVPSIAIFGLNEIGVRFPSMLFGTLSVFMIYFLVVEVASEHHSNKMKRTIGLISALLLAISPWHIQYSRAAFETNTAVFLCLMGATAFLK